MTPADMSAQVDFIVKRFQEALKRCADIEKLFKDFQKDKGDIQTTHQVLADHFVSLTKELQERFNFIKENSTLLNIHIKDISDTLANNLRKTIDNRKDFEEHVKDTRQSILAIVVDYEKNEEAISELSKKYQAFCNSFKVFHDQTSEKLTSQDQKIADASTKHESNSLRIAGFQADTLRIQSNLKEHAQKIANLVSDISQSKEYTNSVANALEKALKTHIQESIAAIPKPQIPSLEDATKATQAKIEPALLDSKNANLRSQNNETKIAILEKKVEQLQLLVNKFQLQG